MICPQCGSSSRHDDGFIVTDVMVAKKITDASLAGNQMKVSATKRLKLSHTCGWWVIGDIDGTHFVADPDQPAPPEH